MAKLREEAINLQDIQEYITAHSDFGFELSILKKLRELGLECRHGGYYKDPVTKKSREFDIRAMITIDRFRVRLAIECKNLKPYFPLLVSCVPREPAESYHEVARTGDPKNDPNVIPNSLYFRSSIYRIQNRFSIYRSGEPVGKCISQIGRTKDKEISYNDAEVYEKLGQCLASADELVSEMYWDGDGEKYYYFTTIIPILVVPNQMLWSVSYDADGAIASKPEQVERSQCYIGKPYIIDNSFIRKSFTI